MRPFLTLPRVNRPLISPPVGFVKHELLVVNRLGEQWAKSVINTASVARLSASTLFYSEVKGYLVEDVANGNGASLCNISDAIGHLTQHAGWYSEIAVIQNGGKASRITDLSKGNKGRVELFPGICMYDLAIREAGIFSFGHSDCVQLAPVDMLQLPDNRNLKAEIASGLNEGDLVVAAIPVNLEALVPEQLIKWGFLCTNRNSRRVIAFIEHPGTIGQLRAGLPRGNTSDFDFYFSTFRFFLSHIALRAIAEAIKPALSAIHAPLKIDLSDHVIEPLFNCDRPAWRDKQGLALANAGKDIAQRLRASGIGVSVASIGALGVSEDLGTYEALEALKFIRQQNGDLWQNIKFVFDTHEQE